MPMRAACRLICAVPFALILAVMPGAVPAFAQCTTVITPLCSAQASDQENLLSPFNLLLNTPAGVAVLNANLQTENAIYLRSTQAQKIASGTVLIPPLISANVLLRAFPNNSSFGYTSAGLPFAPALPSSVADAVNDIGSSAQLNLMKVSFGAVNIYKNAYGLLPGQIDSVGNPPPYQVSAAIYGNPFTPANSSLLAYQNQQTQGAFGINWQDQADSQTGDFPSAHTIWGTVNAITFALLAPGSYQQLAQAAAEFSYDLNVNGVHYPTDVIGGRILATYLIAETLAGNAIYPSANFTPANLATLSAAMQSYLGGGSSSPYATPCANVAGCIAVGTIPTAATYAQQAQAYATYVTYGLPPVSDTTLAPVVPADAHWLIATRFPYLTTAQLNDVLATTELPSGGALDNGTGWARLNLYAAAGGYGAFPSNVTVHMSAALGGLNAFDVWSNNISGPGGLTLQGSGTLILAGNNSYTGDTVVQGGTLAVTGSLAGNLAVGSGGNFVGNGAIGSTLALLPGSAYLAAVSPSGANLIRVGSTATLSGGTVVVSSIGGSPALGSAGPILAAAGGITGRFSALIEPVSGLAAGTRFDVLYGSNAIILAVTPSRYGNLGTAGIAESGGETDIGRVLDAIRPGPRLGARSCPVGAVCAALHTARRWHHHGSR